MRIENRMQLQLWREETVVFWSVEEQDVWQVVQIKSMPV